MDHRGAPLNARGAVTSCAWDATTGYIFINKSRQVLDSFGQNEDDRVTVLCTMYHVWLQHTYVFLQDTHRWLFRDSRMPHR